MDLSTKSKVKRVTIEAVVIRADGSKEDLGVVADSNKNPGIITGVAEWLRQRSS